jgi:hypothetical protein
VAAIFLSGAIARRHALRGFQHESFRQGHYLTVIWQPAHDEETAAIIQKAISDHPPASVMIEITPEMTASSKPNGNTMRI